MTVTAHEPDGRHKTVEDLPYWDISVQAFQSMRDVLKVLDENPQTPGIVVLENHLLVGLVARKDVYEKLGRPFGVELFFKNNIKQFYRLLAKETLVVDWSTSIFDAVKMALARSENNMFEAIIISHPDGYRIVSMQTLLLAQQESMQVLYSEVQELSTKDPLTLINNRRGFFDAVNQKLEPVRQFNVPIAVLMIDIDNFKTINDRYGHFVGDEVIKSVAGVINAQLTGKDVLGRFGGEEYVVFLENISEESALKVAELIREEIAGHFHTINGFKIRVTASIGISYSKGAQRTFDRILAEADQAVYVAKNKGRNRVAAWNQSYGQFPKSHSTFRTAVGESSQTIEISSQTLQGLLRLLYLRDYETEAHTLRVSEMAVRLAEAIRIPKDEIENIRIGALLHDIGKIAIPDKILFKTETLTEAERAIMEEHPQYAYDLLAPISFFRNVLDIPYCHHEQWNGQGYPRRLREDEIPLAARIFSVVDVWDALSSDRPYRPALKQAQIKDFLIQKSGTFFDPSIVPIFIALLENSPRRDR